ncbi:hypothetical protein EON00_16425 [Burkholderia sp. ISTR5]|nr:hypothetical protein [Burkholderia sp. ISTR5]
MPTVFTIDLMVRCFNMVLCFLIEVINQDFYSIDESIAQNDRPGCAECRINCFCTLPLQGTYRSRKTGRRPERRRSRTTARVAAPFYATRCRDATCGAKRVSASRPPGCLPRR